MFNLDSGYIFGLICGFIGGFIGGFISRFISRFIISYFYNFCNIYIQNKILSSQLFDKFYDSIQESTIVNILPIIIEFSKEYNNSFKILFINGCPFIKIIDKNILQNSDFKLLMEFLKNNDIEIMFSSKPEINLDKLN